MLRAKQKCYSYMTPPIEQIRSTHSNMLKEKLRRKFCADRSHVRAFILCPSQYNFLPGEVSVLQQLVFCHQKTESCKKP